MADRIVDNLITIFSFRVNTGGLRQQEVILQKTQNRLRGLGTGVALAGAALTGAAFIVGTTALAFETSMNRLSAISGGTAADLGRFRDQAKALGETTQFTASQVVQAQIALQQAGLKTNEVLRIMPSVLNFAAAGALGMGEAAEIVTKTLQPFQLGVEHATRVTDLIAQAARISNTTVAEMGPAFRQAAVEAATSGLSLEKFAASIALLRNNARIAGQAGTQMRNVILSLTGPSTAAQKAIQSLGLDVEQIGTLARGGQLDAALQLLGDAGIGLEKAAVIFGREASGAGLALIQQREKWDELYTSLRNVDGVAADMAQRQMSGLPGAVLELKSAFEGLQLSIAEGGLIGVLTRVTRVFTWMIRFLNDLAPPFKAFISILIAGGPVLIAFGGGLHLLAWAFRGLPPPIQKNIIALLLYTKKVWLATIATYGLRTAIFGLLGVLGLVITAVILISKYWDKIKGLFGIGGAPAGNGPNGGGGTGGSIPPANGGGPPRGLNPDLAYAAANTGNVTNNNQRTNSFSMGDVNITVPGGNSEEISQHAATEVQRQMQNAVFHADGDIVN